MPVLNINIPETNESWDGDYLPFPIEALKNVRVFYAETLEEVPLVSNGQYYDLMGEDSEFGYLRLPIGSRVNRPFPEIFNSQEDVAIPPLILELTYEWDGTL